jgi:hypothetical protein
LKRTRHLAFICFICICVLLAGCGGNPTSNNETGAKAAVEQMVKAQIGSSNGSEAEKTVTFKYLDVDHDGDRAQISGDALYKIKGRSNSKAVERKMRFKVVLDYYGSKWNVFTEHYWDDYKE